MGGWKSNTVLMIAFPMYGMNGWKQMTEPRSFENKKNFWIRAAVTGLPMMWMRPCRTTPVKRMKRPMIGTGTMAARARYSAYGIAITILPVIRMKRTRTYP